MKALLTLSKWIWQISALLIVILAILVVLGRSAIDNLPDYKNVVTEQISEQLGYEVTIDSLVGEWYTLNPLLFLRGIKLYSETNPQAPVIAFGEIVVEPNLLASVIGQRLIVRKLVINQLDISLEETQDGRWLLGGIGIGGSGESNFDTINKLFFDSRLLSIKSLNAKISFNSGAESSLQLNNISLENSGGFHRLQATAAVGQTAEMASMIIEGRGNPLDYAEFQGKAYVRLNQVNNVGLLRAAFEYWLPAQFDNVGEVQTDINGEIWLALDGKGTGRVNGYLEAAEVPLNWFKQAPPLTNFDAALTGQYQTGRGWQLTAQQVSFSWQGEAIEPLTLSYSQPASTQWGYGQLTISQINLGLLNRIAQQAGILPEKATQLLAELNPTGRVTQLQAKLNAVLENGVDMVVKGNLADIAIDSVKKAPAVKHLNGYFEVHGQDGLLQIDSPDGLSLLYPTAYDDYMHHGSVKGWLNWKVDKEKTLKITSGPIQIGGEEGQGVAFLHLDIPLNRELGPGEMYLQAGIKNSHSRFRHQFIPTTLPDQLINWLDDSVGDADIREAGFIWRGSLGKKDHSDRSIQLYIKAENATLKFQPDWPALHDMAVDLTVNDASASGTIPTAKILDATVNQAKFEMAKQAESGTLMLDITGTGTASVEQGLAILNNSPLKSYLEPLQGWRMAGDTQATLAFAIPIQEISAATYDVDINIEKAQLADPSGRLNFSNLNSVLSYRTGKGLYANNIKANLWQRNPLKAQLKSSDEGLVITGKTSLPVDALAKSFNVTLSPFFAGKTAVDFTFKQSGESQESVLQLTSNLQGISIDLPEPFAKPAQDPVATDISLAMGKDYSHYQANVGELLRTRLVVTADAIDRGVIEIGTTDETQLIELNRVEPSSKQPEPSQLIVYGHLATFKMTEWQPVYDHFLGSTNLAVQKVTPQINMQIEELSVAGTTLGNVTLSGYREAVETEAVNQAIQPGKPNTHDTVQPIQTQADTEPGTMETIMDAPESAPKRRWRFDFTSETADGRIKLPAQSIDPFDLALNRLAITLPEKTVSEEANANSWLTAINPAELPLMDVSIDELSIDGRKLGTLGFKLKPYETGAVFSELKGEFGGLVFGGEKDIITRLVWNQTPDDVLTRFEGLVKTANIGDSLEFWGLPRMMDSKSAYLLADLQWHGLPDQLKLNRLKGDLVLGAEKGVFYNSPTVTTDAAIRTLGLMNFANWVRRLKLDFSDIFSKGVSYDEISGGLQFNQGIMDFSPEIKVKMPSGRMLLSGQANLDTEQLNAGLVMTIPISTNLPWIAALAGGLPAAAGVYLTSKLFESEVDRFSSLSYQLTGSWDDPDIAVDKIFSDKAPKK